MKKGNARSKIVIGVIFLISFSGPLIIAKFTLFPTKLTSFSDEAASWFSFWASYSGTLATLLVALITWMNSRKMEELQRRYYELETDVNLRLSKVGIVPQILEKGKLECYKFTFIFDNIAKNLIREIGFRAYERPDGEVQKAKGQITISIRNTKEALDIIDPEYYLRDGNPVLQFGLIIDSFPMKKEFAQFYYYFSQFSMDVPKMELDIKIDVRYGESIQDTVERSLLVELLPTPIIEHRKKYLEFSKEEYAAESYEVLIENYKLERIKI